MKCYYHPEEDAVGKCRCGKYLCQKCVSQYSEVICYDCAIAPFKKQKEEYIKQKMYRYELYKKTKKGAYFWGTAIFCYFTFVSGPFQHIFNGILLSYWFITFLITITGLYGKFAYSGKPPQPEINADTKAVVNELSSIRMGMDIYKISDFISSKTFVFIILIIPCLILGLVFWPVVEWSMRTSEKNFKKFLEETDESSFEVPEN